MTEQACPADVSALSEGPAPWLDIRSVAVIGASEDQSKFGGRLFKNLLRHGFGGDVYPINAGRQELFGIKTYPDLHALPAAPDAFVLALPSHLVRDQVIAAAQRGTRLGIIISAGFSDIDEAGQAQEQELVDIARRHGMRLVGPNCLGIISVDKGLVLCSSPILERSSLPQRPVGFVSQSGALMTTAFDKAWSMGGGFSHGFSVGNQADLEICDFIEFMVADRSTKVICAYIEGLKDAPRFLACARAARDAGKPLLIVKAGRSQAGQQAAFSHTASIAGDAAVFEAACREQGALVLGDLNTMLLTANYLATQPTRTLRHLAIVSPSGGGGALAADIASEAGLELAEFGEPTRSLLSQCYPPRQIKNPLDLGARTAGDERAGAQLTCQAVQQDPAVDAVLGVTAMAPIPWQMQLIEALAEQGRQHRKPVIVAVDAGQTSDPVRQRLAELGLPYANSTADAVQALRHARQWQAMQPVAAQPRPAECPRSPLSFGPGQYSEHDTKAMLAAYGVTANEGRIARTAEDAAAIARQLGYPVVLKIVSADIVHKSDVGGVVTGLASEEDVRKAHDQILQNVALRRPGARIDGVLVQRMVHGHVELIVGGRRDATFGPVIVVGAGGTLVELLPERFLATVPVTRQAVLQGLQSLTLWPVLQGYRGKAVALDAMVESIVRLSWMMHDLGKHDFEIDINPLLVNADEACAVDARLLIR